MRVEFLLQTDRGYPKDTGVTVFTLATPGNPLRYNTHFCFFVFLLVYNPKNLKSPLVLDSK